MRPMKIPSGAAGMSHPTYTATTPSIIQGVIVVGVETEFEICHRCGIDVSANIGLGMAMNFGTVEVYTQIKLQKLE